jgi:hypothetical protein
MMKRIAAVLVVGAGFMFSAVADDPPDDGGIGASCQDPVGPNSCAYYCPNGPACSECCSAFTGLGAQECHRQCELKFFS